MTREEIEKDVARFLAKGGQIQHIPMGMGSFNMAETFEANAVRKRKPNKGVAISLAKRRQARENKRV